MILVYIPVYNRLIQNFHGLSYYYQILSVSCDSNQSVIKFSYSIAFSIIKLWLRNFVVMACVLFIYYVISTLEYNLLELISILYHRHKHIFNVFMNTNKVCWTQQIEKVYDGWHKYTPNRFYLFSLTVHANSSNVFTNNK